MTVTTPSGFRATGIASGIRRSGKLDLALVVNDGPMYTAAGVFTANRVQAAPVKYSREVLKDGTVRAVVLNAGSANACTGARGYADTIATAEHVASALSVTSNDVAVCSTGLIGTFLPMECVLSGVDKAVSVLSSDGGAAAAEAILTTDTYSKTAVYNADNYTLGAMVKGAGMLAPSLATMLCVITTDAQIDNTMAEKALRYATSQTFDRVDSDGCMSTNDTVLLLANGAAGYQPGIDEFASSLTALCEDLAQQICADAEGATKEVTINVLGAATETDAVEVGRAIARNNLLKCALFGNDPNWGRVLAAVGTTSATFDPDALDVAMNGVWVCREGAAVPGVDPVDLTGRHVGITIELHAGSAEASIRTNDLSIAYVHSNSAYST